MPYQYDVRGGIIQCALCRSGNLEVIEKIGGENLGYLAYRYKCLKCGMTLRYEPKRRGWSNEATIHLNPYAGFKRGLRIPM